ncbi:hypothetical protein [Streptomyces sp. JNUCC 63]
MSDGNSVADRKSPAQIDRKLRDDPVIVSADPDDTTYEMFKNEARRFKQRALLEAMAATSLALEGKGTRE